MRAAGLPREWSQYSRVSMWRTTQSWFHDRVPDAVGTRHIEGVLLAEPYIELR